MSFLLLQPPFVRHLPSAHDDDGFFVSEAALNGRDGIGVNAARDNRRLVGHPGLACGVVLVWFAIECKQSC